MRRTLPRSAARLLAWVVRDAAAREGLVGDLEERYAALPGRGRVRRALWLGRELISAAAHYTMDRGRSRAFDRGGDMGTIDILRQDLGFAVRALRRRPGFAALVVTTLALGIGATTAIFSLVNGLLLEPLPYLSSERLVVINEASANGFMASVSLPNYRDWKERARSFDRFSALLPGSSRLSRPDGARVIEVGWVHGGFFETFGVDAVLGRVFTEAESEPGAAPVVVLGHALWVSELGADSSIVGKTIRLGGEPQTVLGIMPADFQPYHDVLAYRPMGLIADRIAWDDRHTGSGTEILARLAPGVSPETSQRELDEIAAGLRVELGDEAIGAGHLTPLRTSYLGDSDRQVVLLMVAVAFVLLVACANVANLLLVRSETRKGEIALRAALGAARGRVHRQLLTESLVFGVAGGFLGAGLGWLGLQVLLRAAGNALPAAFHGRIHLDGGVLLLTAALSVGTAVAAGFIPALRSTRARLAEALRDANRTVGSGGRARNALISTEIALSMVLLVGAGLLIRSLSNLQRVDKGFDGSGVLTLRLAEGGMPSTREQWTTYQNEIRDRIRALPGVTGVAASQIFPLSGNSWEMLYKDEGTPPGERGESVLLTMVSPEYFDLYGIELVQGRSFTDQDRWGSSENVAIVDESLAEARWPGESPLGKRVSFEQPNGPDGTPVDIWRTVVGVVRPVRHYELASPSRIEVYTPLAQSASWGLTCYLSVRASADPGALVPGIRSVVAEVDPDAALYRIRTMDEVIAARLGVRRALGDLFTIFAALTLVLGAVGIYSVVSHATALRVREMGVRIALGGAPRALVGLMVKESLMPVLVGLAGGVAASLVLGRVLGAFLFEVRPAEPAILATAALTLLAVAALSAWIPARGAAGVEPTEALRAE